MRIRPLAVALAIVGVVSSFPGSPSRAAETPERAVPPSTSKRPALHGFEENLGQLDPRAAFAARADTGTLFVTASGAVFTWARNSPTPARPLVDQFTGYSPGLAPGLTPPSGVTTGFVGWRFLGMDRKASLIGEGPMRSDVYRICGLATRPGSATARTFKRVRQTGVYPGIDAVHYEGTRGFEYDMIVHPGADPGQIAMAIDGASAVSIDTQGALVLTTPSGDIRHQAPVAYQMRDGVRELVSCRYQPDAARSIRFVLASYDPTRELVIDPVILSSLIFGGSDAEFSYNVAADNYGNSYLVGTTYSLDFPTVLPLQPAYGGNSDVYVVKIGPDGETPRWTTYLGGSGFDFGAGIAVDDLGRVYVSGTTSSATFPVTAGSFQPQIRGVSDAFLIRLSPDGQVVEYGTFVGGTNADSCNGLALDSSLNVAIIGTTSSTNLPLKNAFQTTNRGGQDAWVAVVNAGEGSLAFSTYAGGSQQDIPNAVDTDPDGNVYVAGFTQSTNFPTFNGFQGTFQGGAFDSFALKLTPSGELAYGSFLGGSGNDVAYAVAADDNGRVFVGGFTESADFPLQSPFQATLKGASDGFLAVLPTTVTPRLPGIVDYLSYYGGDGFDGVYSFRIVNGRLYAAGRTNSGTSFPSINQVPGTTQGPIDTFYVVFDLVGQAELAIDVSSLLGNGLNQTVTGVDVPDGGMDRGVPFVFGSLDLPTTGISDAFLMSAGGNDPVKQDLEVGLGVSPITDGQNLVITLSFKNIGIQTMQGFDGRVTYNSPTDAKPAAGTSMDVDLTFDSESMSIDFASPEPLNVGQTKVVVLDATLLDPAAIALLVEVVGAPLDDEDDAYENNTDKEESRRGGSDSDDDDREISSPVTQGPVMSADFRPPPPREEFDVSLVDNGVVMKAPLGAAARGRAAHPSLVGSRVGIAATVAAPFERLRYPGPTRGYNIYASTTPGFTPSPTNFFRYIPYDQPFTNVEGAPAGSYFKATSVYGSSESEPSAVFGGPSPDVTKVKLAATKVIIDGTNFVGPVSVLFDGVPFESPAKLKKNDTRVQQKGLLVTGETVGLYVQRRGRVLVTVKTAAGTSVHFYVE